MSLRGGGVTVHVVPGGPRRWSVDAGLVRVEVVGTRFRLERGDEEVLVEVERGRVQVAGPALGAGRVELGPGESRRFRRPVAEAASPHGGEPRAAVEAPPAGPQTATTRREAWRALAAERRFAEAFDALSEQGHAQRTATATSVDELLTLADVARLGGHPRQAVAPLSRILDEHSGDRRAAVAAFTLGRLHTDELGEPGRGAEAFRRVIALGPPSALRESAHARLVEACARAGDQVGARRAAADYLERYPAGRWADDVRAWSASTE
jgi:transmembrane sensor